MTSADFNSFKSELEKSVLEMIKETKNIPKSAYDQYEAFTSAVNWNQNWIRALIAFHIINYILFIVYRRNMTFQVVLFFILTFVIASLEWLNSYCSRNWSVFSDQNYFDKHGVFMGVMVASPILLFCTFQLINFLIIASNLLIKAKKLELSQKKKQKNN